MNFKSLFFILFCIWKSNDYTHLGAIFRKRVSNLTKTRLPPCGAVKTWSCNFCQKTYGKWHVNVHQQRTIYGVCHKWSFLQHCRRRNYNAPAANNNIVVMKFYALFLQKQCYLFKRELLKMKELKWVWLQFTYSEKATKIWKKMFDIFFSQMVFIVTFDTMGVKMYWNICLEVNFLTLFWQSVAFVSQFNTLLY